MAGRQGLGKGGYKVILEFTINEDGTIANTKPIAATKVCTNCIKEALRVISKSPKWIPAMKSDNPVKYKVKQSFIFEVL